MEQREFNRRTMLAAVAAGGIEAVWSRRVPAAVDLETLSFVVVSDTHLGRNNNESAERNWRKTIDEVNLAPGQFVLHLGDVVDGGRESQYPRYVETRKLLKKPVHEIPGNHDPAKLFEKYVAKQTDRSVDYGGVRFVLFNNAHRDSHHGFITSKQIDWIESQCAEAAKLDLRIVICCHVPIHTNRHPDRGWYVKPNDGQRAFYQLRQRYADRIVACFHGHFHNGIRGWRDHGRTVEVLFPSVCYNQNRALKKQIADGKAKGFFVDELRPGFVLAELGKGRLTLRYKPLGHARNGEYQADWK